MPNYTLSQVSIGAPPMVFPEWKIPLWVNGTTYTSTNSTSAMLAIKGSTSPVPTTSPPSSATLHILSPSWNPNQQFALEVAANSTQAVNCHIALWDITAGAVVSASQVLPGVGWSLYRSASFTLVPGHKYGVAMWVSGSNTVYLTRAYLVALLS